MDTIMIFTLVCIWLSTVHIIFADHFAFAHILLTGLGFVLIVVCAPIDAWMGSPVISVCSLCFQIRMIVYPGPALRVGDDVLDRVRSL